MLRNEAQKGTQARLSPVWFYPLTMHTHGCVLNTVNLHSWSVFVKIPAKTNNNKNKINMLMK